MKTYEQIVKEYRKRQHDTVVDTIATGLTYLDDVAVEAGVLEETGILPELTEVACGALPFVIIAAQEGTKIVLGRKPASTGAKDGAFRMVKTGAALGVGGAVASAAGFWAAIPATMGVRALFDRYRSRTLTGMRVKARTTRLRELNTLLRTQSSQPEGPAEPLEGEITLALAGAEGQKVPL